MKKPIRAVAALLLLCSVTTIKAQWVTIPASFATYISNYVASAAISGGQLDTTNTTITTVTNMTISDYSVTDITGIQYFKALQNLVVYGSLSTVPQLPATLYSFECYNYHGTSFPSSWPATIGAIKFHNASLTSVSSIPSTVTILDLDGCLSLTSVSTLPIGLQHLELENSSSINPVPALPDALQYVDVSFTTYGPLTAFPASIQSFSCAFCSNVTFIPNAPPGLMSLAANHSNANSVGILPTTMDYLNLSATPMSTINQLPLVVNSYLRLDSMPNLSTIVADSVAVGYGFSASSSPSASNAIGNLLNYVHNLPSSIQAISILVSNSGLSNTPLFAAIIDSLDMSYNPISVLTQQNYFFSAGFNTNILPFDQGPGTYFNFSYCQLSYFGYGFFSSQNAASSVDVSYNEFSVINDLPLIASGPNYYYYNNNINLNLSNNIISQVSEPLTAYGADITNNQITCLPYLIGMYYLNSSGNPMDCLPNIPEQPFTSDIGLTVCTANNTYGCPLLSETGGLVFNDLNQNGYLDANETVAPGYNVLMNPANSLHKSDSSGRYIFQCQPFVYYTINAQPTYPYRRITTQPYTEDFQGLGFIDTLYQLGVYTLPNVNDMAIYIDEITQPRPGFHQYYSYYAINEGTTVENGNVVMYFDPALNYQSSTPAGTVSGNKITWPVTSLQPLARFTAVIDFIVPVPVVLGSTISNGVHALCNTPDTTQYNNSDSSVDVAVGSYDPNFKSVSPKNGLSQQQIVAGQSLTYSVHFQNTGTDTAYNVVVIDSLSSGLDLSTFNFIASSNVATWSIDNSVLTVTFNNIMLPDSGETQLGSIGYFTYSVKPFATATVGEQIQNTAYIYFDFNAPVATNTAVTNVSTFVLVQPQPQYLCSSEPLMLTITTSSDVHNVMWYKNGIATGVTSDTLLLDSATVNDAGFYTCYLYTGNGTTYKSNEVGVLVVDRSAPLTPYMSLTTPLCSISPASASVQTGTYRKYLWYKNDTLVSQYPVLDFNSGTYPEGTRLKSIVSDSLPCEGRISVETDTVLHYVTDTISVSISPRNVNVCPGASVMFTAATTNTSGTTISWYKNSTLEGTGDSITISNLQNSDQVTTILSYTYHYACSQAIIGNHNFTRDTIFINADSTLPSTINVAPLSTTTCTGQAATYNATTTNTGNNTHYTWYKNGHVIGTDANTFTSNTPANGDLVTCQLITNGCSAAILDTVASNTITTAVAATITPTATISILNRYNSQCDSATFAVSVSDIGTGASYLWKRNGVSMSTTVVPTANLHALNAGDTITCVISTGLSCAPVVTSAPLYYYGGTPSNFRIAAFSTYICANQNNEIFLQTASVYSTTAYSWYKNGVFKGHNDYYYANDSADYTIYAKFAGLGCYAPGVSIDTLQVHILTPQNLSGHITLSPLANCIINYYNFDFVTSPANLTGTYTWFVNGNAYASGGPVSPVTMYSLQEGDIVSCTFIPASGSLCLIGSASDVYVVHLVHETPEVSIAQNTNVICPGGSKTFTAAQTYGGSFPHYQWFQNGSVVGSNSDTYVANTINAGDHVYCVMISDNPCALPASANSDTLVMVTGTAAIPSSVAVTGPQSTLCQGTSATFTASPTNGGTSPVYQWQVDGTNAGNNSPAFITSSLNNNDSVKCYLTSSLSCVTPVTAVSNSVTVSIDTNVVPVISITADHDTVCVGTNITFNSTTGNPGTSPTYQWKVNGINAGSNQASFNSSGLDNNDVVVCQVTSNAHCVLPDTASSNIVVIDVESAPVANVTQSGGLCQGDTVVLTAPVGSYTYVWSNAATSQSITVNADGNYAVTVTNSISCSDSSAPVAIAFHTLPVPVISRTGSMLSTTAESTYQWYSNNSPVNNATGQNITITQNGQYTVMVTDANGCANMSAVYTVTGLDVTAINADFDVQLYPNPNNGSFILKFGDAITRDIIITDELGREILSDKVTTSKNFDLNTLAPGIYFVQIHQDKLIKNLKFSLVK